MLSTETNQLQRYTSPVGGGGGASVVGVSVVGVVGVVLDTPMIPIVCELHVPHALAQFFSM